MWWHSHFNKVKTQTLFLDNISEEYLQATKICIENCGQDIVIASVYSPPRFTISADQYEEFYKSLGTRFLAAGDYNAKHTYWGSRLITPRGRTLFNSIAKMGLDVISSGEPTYWPSDRQKIPDVIDFGVTKNISRELVDVEASLDLSSDHSPTIVSFAFHKDTSYLSHI
ncbi:RNA-directed DNA polymerase from mobile element jockey [Eumeta japonica]|uniref:RNA-directed DNA polymerase from mobile element jockey n=1 Tax=Eumeta variegata TaxID=151549 RepID=A0A4C1TDK2_EUMVA|nr:RNA-directed DNA polymerase from mobile element jockey [Eumeta japonica]